MTSCCEYGQCKEGFGCPVRSTKTQLQIESERISKEVEETEKWGTSSHVLFWVCLTIFVGALCLKYSALPFFL